MKRAPRPGRYPERFGQDLATLVLAVYLAAPGSVFAAKVRLVAALPAEKREVTPPALFVEVLTPSSAPVRAVALDCRDDGLCSATTQIDPGSWIVRGTKESPYWFRPLPVQVADLDQEILLTRIYPLTRIALAVEPEVAALRLRFRLSSETSTSFPDATSCVLEGRRWGCRVPAAPLDLRFEADGYVPIHHWNVTASTLDTQAGGGLTFQPGSSVGIWVVGWNPEQSALDARLAAVEPSGVVRPSVSVAPFRVHRLNATSAFLFAGPVPPGKYEIRVQQKGTIGARYSVLTVDPAAALLLPIPLRLEGERGSLRVQVEPALTTTGESWQIQLLFGDATQGSVEEVGRWDFAGEVLISPLVEGPYRVRLLDSAGARWADEVVEIGSKLSTLEIRLDSHAVAGEVLLGEDPLPEAALHFRREGVAQQFVSDSSGRFAGTLAGTGTWEVRVLSRTPSVDRRVAVEIGAAPAGSPSKIRIVLPNRGVSGNVVHASGEGAARAFVRFIRKGSSGSLGSVRTREEGEFEITGLEHGTLTLWAESESEASDEVEVDISEEAGGPRNLRLELRPRTKLRGTITSAAGTVPNASVEFRSAVSPVHSVVDATAVEPDGSFEHELAAGSFPLLVTASAPGLATAMVVVATANPPVEIHLAMDVAPVVIHDSVSTNSRGDGRHMVLVQGGLPLLEGPTGAFRRVARQDGSMSARANIAAGPFWACSGTFTELHQLLVTGQRSPAVRCGSGVAAPGAKVEVHLTADGTDRPR